MGEESRQSKGNRKRIIRKGGNERKEGVEWVEREEERDKSKKE